MTDTANAGSIKNQDFYDESEIIKKEKVIDFSIYGGITFGLILAIIYKSFIPFLLAGGSSVILMFIIKGLSGNKNLNNYIISTIYGLLAGMIIFQSGGILAYHPVIFIYLSLLIFLKGWKYLIPYLFVTIIYLITLAFIYSETLLLNSLGPIDHYLSVYVGLILVSAFIISLITEKYKNITAENVKIKKEHAALKKNIEHNLQYANQIASGNFDINYEFKEGDVLGQSLVEMSKSLKKAAVEEKQRNWTVEGVAQIADILRLNHQDINELAYNVISHLVKYVNAKQGGIFILNEENNDDPYLELKGCYAYERRKYQEKKVAIGQGLIGQAYLEKEMIFMTDLPENYVNIKSGLGDANPNSIVIIPLKVEDQVIGIIELASFKIFAPHERSFFEKVSENIASAIISSKVKDQTSRLLEESQQQSEEMRAQEEEMRQNMEELQATQETLQRESKEKARIQHEVEKTRDFLQRVINAIPDPVFVKDREHRIILINDALASHNKLKPEDLIGKNDYDMFPKEEADEFYQAEEKLFLERGEFTIEEKATRGGENTYSITKKRIVENEDGELFLVGINHDITNRKKIEKSLEEERYLLDALMSFTSDNIYFKDKESKFIRVSDNMAKAFGVSSPEDLVGKSDFDFFTRGHALPAFEAEQEIINSRKPLLNLVEKETWEDGRESYVSTSKMPLLDQKGEVIGTFGISRDVTETKLAEIEVQKSEKRLSALLNYSDAIVFTLNEENIYTYISPTYYRYAAIEEGSLLNEPVKDYIHTDDYKKFNLILTQVKNKQLKDGKIKIRHKGRDEQYVKMELEIHNALDDESIKGIVIHASVL